MVRSSLGKQESYGVTTKEIEQGERELMEGLNYEMRCHHPHTAIRVLAKEVSTFLSENDRPQHLAGSEERDPSNILDKETASPRQVCDFSDAIRIKSLYERSITVAQNALMFSDVPFMFSPGPIAFAAVAIASRNGRRPIRGVRGKASLEPGVREFLRVRFPAEQEYDLRDFESQVGKIVGELDKTTVMEPKMLAACQSEEPRGSDDKSLQIYEIRRVSSKATVLRASRDHCQEGRYQSPRKRNFAHEPLVDRVEIAQAKIPKVTPTRLY